MLIIKKGVVLDIVCTNSGFVILRHYNHKLEILGCT